MTCLYRRLVADLQKSINITGDEIVNDKGEYKLVPNFLEMGTYKHSDEIRLSAEEIVNLHIDFVTGMKKKDICEKYKICNGTLHKRLRRYIMNINFIYPEGIENSIIYPNFSKEYRKVF